MFFALANLLSTYAFQPSWFLKLEEGRRSFVLPKLKLNNIKTCRGPAPFEGCKKKMLEEFRRVERSLSCCPGLCSKRKQLPFISHALGWRGGAGGREMETYAAIMLKASVTVFKNM